MNEFIDYLIAADACEDAVLFAQSCASPQEAWDTCPRGDWMMWLLERHPPEKHVSVALSVRFARQALPYAGDLTRVAERAIEAAEAVLHDDSAETRDAAWAAGDAARAAAEAAGAAARAAAEAAAEAAWAAAWAADEAAAWAAEAAAGAAAGAAEAAGDAAGAGAEQARWIREYVPAIPAFEHAAT